MKIVDDETGAISYRKDWAWFYVNAIVLGLSGSLLFLCVGSRLIEEAVSLCPCVASLIFVFGGVLILVGSVDKVVRSSLYRVTLLNDRVEWLSGFLLKSIPYSEIAEIEKSHCHDEKIVLLLRAQSGDVKSDSREFLFGTSHDINDFIAELRSRIRSP